MISTFIDSEQYRELPFENVDATDIHRILVPFVDQRLENLRFESVSTLKWVRSTDAPVRQILTWNKDLYGILRPSWGLSIDWVPHVGNTKITFCRTTKSARVAIGVTGQTSDAWHHRLLWNRTKAGIEIFAKPMVDGVLEEATDFWSAYKTIDDFIARFQKIRNKHGCDFEPNWPASEAFCLAHAGRFAEARSLLIEEEASGYLNWHSDYNRSKLRSDLLSEIDKLEAKAQ